jgi:hypothetical protein
MVRGRQLLRKRAQAIAEVAGKFSPTPAGLKSAPAESRCQSTRFIQHSIPSASKSRSVEWHDHPPPGLTGSVVPGGAEPRWSGNIQTVPTDETSQQYHNLTFDLFPAARGQTERQQIPAGRYYRVTR